MPCVAALVLGAVAAMPAAAQLRELDRSRGRAMLAQVRKDLEQHYYDETLRGMDLPALVASATTRIDAATTIDEVMTAIAQVTLTFGDSHTYFAPPRRRVRVDYGWELQLVGDSARVSRVRPGSDAAAQGVRLGDLVVSVNGYRPTRQNHWQLLYLYQVLRPQPGLRVVLQTPGDAPRELDLAAKVQTQWPVIDLAGNDGGRDFWATLAEVELDAWRWRSRFAAVGDGVLLWQLREFSGDDTEVRDLLELARQHHTLILDLRGNPGGAEKTMLALIGGLFEADLPVARLVSRGETRTLTARGAGARRFTGRLVVLIDSRSASASELLARTVQLARRGTVIGDRTAGAVLRSRYLGHRMGGDAVVVYGVSVTTAEVLLPDGDRLEQVGVTPDEVVLPSPEDMAGRRDPVLARALRLAGLEISDTAALAKLRLH